MTNHRIRTAAMSLMMFPVPACAQAADQQTPTPRKFAAAAGGFTLQTFVQRHKRKLMAGDTDGDGKVSRAEFLAAANAGKVDPTKRFARIDRNGDSLLDKTEIDAMLTLRFARLDADGDGVLSPDERAKHHQRGAAESGAES